MVRARDQGDLVRQSMGYQPEHIVESVGVPGVENLHEYSKEEIADVLTNILKARANEVSIKYTVGKGVEVTTLNPLRT